MTNMKAALAPDLNRRLQEGTVIPAHPLALNEKGKLDEQRQRLLTRYYLASGAGGVAVGVHTTQFEIRKPEFNLLEPVLQVAAEEIDRFSDGHKIIKVAGITGPRSQAIREAELARRYGYHLGLVSMGGLSSLSETELVERAVAISDIIPIFGFYLQPAVGGRLLSYRFWRDLSDIPNLYAIKVAAFNRYQTLDVVRAVCDSPRRDEIALYTGNDDNIVADLLTPYQFVVNGTHFRKEFVGGLLGHWAVWTSVAVQLLQQIKAGRGSRNSSLLPLLQTGVHITDMNAALFDPVNNYRGCIAGIHEILFRQGLLTNTACLNPEEKLSPGQAAEIDRVCRQYPELTDDEFVKDFLEKEKTPHLS